MERIYCSFEHRKSLGVRIHGLWNICYSYFGTCSVKILNTIYCFALWMEGHFLNRSYGSQRMTTYARIQNFLKGGSEEVIVFCGGGGWRLGFWGLFFGKFTMNLINKDFSGLGASRFGHATSLVLLLCSR